MDQYPKPIKIFAGLNRHETFDFIVSSLPAKSVIVCLNEDPKQFEVTHLSQAKRGYVEMGNSRITTICGIKEITVVDYWGFKDMLENQTCFTHLVFTDISAQIDETENFIELLLWLTGFSQKHRCSIICELHLRQSGEQQILVELMAKASFSPFLWRREEISSYVFCYSIVVSKIAKESLANNRGL